MGETYSKYRGPDFIRAPHASGAPGEGPDDMAQVSPRSGVVSYDMKQMKKKVKRNEVANTPMARAKMADKAPKINLRKEYKD
jgi:hypothetical protein